jgi:hypothetical protein
MILIFKKYFFLHKVLQIILQKSKKIITNYTQCEKPSHDI